MLPKDHSNGWELYGIQTVNSLLIHIQRQVKMKGVLVLMRIVPNAIFTRSKVEWVINSFEPFKSSGKDGIFPALLQKGGEALIDSLTNIFKASLSSVHIAKIWTQVRVVFISKAEKRTKQIQI